MANLVDIHKYRVPNPSEPTVISILFRTLAQHFPKGIPFIPRSKKPKNTYREIVDIAKQVRTAAEGDAVWNTWYALSDRIAAEFSNIASDYKKKAKQIRSPHCKCLLNQGPVRRRRTFGLAFNFLLSRLPRIWWLLKASLICLAAPGGVGIVRKGLLWSQDSLILSISVQFHCEFQKSTRFTQLLRISGFNKIIITRITPKTADCGTDDAWRIVWMNCSGGFP